MRSITSPSGVRALRYSAAAVSLSIALAGPATAQVSSPADAPAAGTSNPKLRTREQQSREARLRSIDWRGRDAANYRGTRVAVEAMKEDFVRLQVLRNEIVRHVTAGTPLDYKLLAKRTKEIHKRADRMKAVMMPLLPEEAERVQSQQVELDAEQVRSALVTLCRLIDSFTESSIFELPGVVDVEQSAKAGGDLQTIVTLSEGMRRETERLSRVRH